MTVKELKTKIENLNDDVLVVMLSYDNSYQEVSVHIAQAGIVGNYIGEYHDDGHKDRIWFQQPDKIVDVLVIS